MKLTDFSVNRPIAIVMFVLIAVILGFVSLTGLSLDLFPELNVPVGLVITEYSGAGPMEIENLVTRPLEQAIGSVGGLKGIQSVSMVGTSLIVPEFEWGTDMNQATADIREKIDLVKGYLPSEVGNPLVIKMDPNLLPVVQLVATSDMSLVDLKTLLEDKVVNRLERIDGVASVQLMGGLTREIRIEADPAKLAYYGISIPQIVQALQGDNLNLSSGKVDLGSKDLLVRIKGEYLDINEIGDVTLITNTGALVRLRDLGEIVDGYQEVHSFSRVNDQESIGINISKQTHANTVTVSREVRKVLAHLENELPGSVKISTLWDQAEYIELTIRNMIENLITGGLLAVLILYVFLRNIRSTLVVAIAMPICVIVTFVMVYFGGLTLNIMSLGGLALGIGMMVDNSIVILENIFRHREEGLGRKEAAIFGADEVTSAITASTLTTIAVFFPIVFVQGIASQLFRELAMTVSFSLAASLLTALTLVPMMSARLLRVVRADGAINNNNHGLDPGSWRYRILTAWARGLNQLNVYYRRLLAWSLKHRLRVIVIVTLIVVGSLALLPFIGAEFIPAMDMGYMGVSVSLPYGAKLEETDKILSRVEDILLETPEIETIATTVGSATGAYSGGLDMGSPENGRIDVVFKDLKDRKRSTLEVADEVRRAVADIAGAEITVDVGDAASQMGMTLAPVEVIIEGDELPVLTAIAEQVEEIVRSVPGTREVANSYEEGRPEVQIRVNRQKAAQYGLSAAQVAASVRTSLQGQTATRYQVGGEEIDVRVVLAEESRQNLADVENIELLTPFGYKVPVKEVVEIEVTQGANAIQRRNQTRFISVTAQIAGRDLNSIMKDIRDQLGRLSLPDGYAVDYGGATEQMTEAFGSLGKALILAIVLIYMIMAAQFESLFHPFVIMFSMPVSVVGVILSLFLTGRTLNVISFIGVIILAGIVVNNAIVLVDYINTLRRRGMERDQAILAAGPVRLRPILMTALTTILAMIPLAMGLGEGGEAGAPLATAIIGGLTTSTFLTLVLVPVVYSLFDDLGQKIAAGLSKKKEQKAEAGV